MPIYLITGGTGTQGGAVLDSLLMRGECTLRTISRTPESEQCKVLKAKGVEVYHGDMHNIHSLGKALNGVDAIFSVQDFYAKSSGYHGEIEQGRNLLHAALSAGVGHLVQSTMAFTETPKDVEHFKSKFEIEKLILASGIPHTLIGTVWFMNNILNPKKGGNLTMPALSGSLKRETPFPMLDVRDLGELVATVMKEPDTFVNKRLDIAGDVLNIRQMKEVYFKVTGKHATSWNMPNLLLRLFSPDFAAQLRWHNAVNWSIDSSVLKTHVPDARSFEDYLRLHPKAVL